MKIVPIAGLLGFFLIATVNSKSPLQIKHEPIFPRHSHSGLAGSSEPDVLRISPKSRLPTSFIPTHYDLKIRPVLDTPDPIDNATIFTAPGSVTINVTCKAPTNLVILHASAELTIDALKTQVINPNDDTDVITITNQTRVESSQFYVIELDKQLTVNGTYQIYMEFVAPIALPPVLNGLYRSSYIKPDNTTSYIATTQFEALAARQAFPCFDEPWMKATFKVHIGYLTTKYTALGNGLALQGEEDIGNNWAYRSYEQTVAMSTYLVAIVVAEYDFAEAASGLFNKPVRTYGPPHLINDQSGGKYSADVAAKMLTFFEEEYQIDYKLGKLDSVAIPDFSFGAMENWGLNIYREPFLLYYENVTSEAERNRINIILAHELAHQWFGNLVSCQFWDQIYLNEGFATYNEFIGANAVFPEFDSLKIQVQDALQAALAFDASPATHPIVNAASGDNNNDEIMVYFDRITYEKGGSLIRMMEGFLGKDTLKRGLIEYLNKMSFLGAHQNDLFESLTVRAHDEGKLPLDVTVRDVMDTWTLQSGFPIVTVSRADASRIYISQSRFTSNAQYTNPQDLDPNDLWEIPVALASQGSPDFTNHTPKFWINKNVALRSYEIDTSRWLVVNPQGTGYYRVLYDQSLLTLILQQLANDFNSINELSRSQLTDDYFTFAGSNYIALETALEFTKQLGKESELVVWTTVFIHLRPIFNKALGTAIFDEFRQYLGPRLIDALNLIGLEQTASHKGANVLLRAQLLDWACAMDQAACLTYASSLFEQWSALPGGDHTKVPADFPQVIYCAAVSSGGESNFNQVYARYVLEGTVEKHRQFYLSALGCTQDPSLLARLQEQVLAMPSELRSINDKVTVLQRLAANTISRTSLITYLRENAAILIGTLGADNVGKVVQTLSTYVSIQTHLDSIQSFIRDNEASFDSVEGLLETLQGYVRTIQANVAWKDTYEQRLIDWFRNAK